MKTLLLLELLYLCHGVLAQHPTRREVTLYGANDPLIILNNGTFESAVQGSSTAWIVQFYNSWCGHCQSYAPHWKLFASHVKGWSHFVKVGVLDCSTEDNTKLCRDYEITGTPTVKLFPANTVQPGFLGYTTKARNVSEVEQVVIEFLTTQQAEGKGSVSWPSLQSYIGPTGDIWEDIGSSQLEKVAIVVEPNTSYIGRAAVLDLAVYRPEVYILTMLGEDEHLSLLLKERKLNSDNSYYIKTTILEPGSWISRDKLVDMVKEKFNLMDVATTLAPSITDMDYTGIDGESDGSYELNIDISQFPKDQVFMVDIENAIAYALRNEIAQRSQFNITEQRVLIDFLRVLVQHLPLRQVVSTFLDKLHEFILQQNYTIGGSELEEAFLSLSSPGYSELPSVREWVGCQGSLPQYRGYPCGLWTTFHAITANITDQKAAESVLPAIHGFVKYFFGCRECSKHFQEMYASDGGAEVNTPDDVLLWLWQAHNKVNFRIKGSASEDPEHPKLLFPNTELCPDCSVSGRYVDVQILSYLRSVYGKDRITLVGTQEEPKGFPRSKEHTGGQKGRRRNKGSGRSRRRKKGGKKHSRKGRNETDIENRRKERKGRKSVKDGHIDDGNKEKKRRGKKRIDNKRKKKMKRQEKKRIRGRNNKATHIYI